MINWLSGQINARNGAFDEAIASFQAVLSTKIPERKIDLSLDYEVNNELAFAFYARAMQASSTSPERIDYLKKAVAAYRRTLSIDSENVTAHHVLGQAYGAAPWGANESRCRGCRFGCYKGQRIGTSQCRCALETCQHGSGLDGPVAKRLPEAQRLASEIARFVDGPRPRYQSRLAPLYELVETLSPAWDKETDPELFRALTRALEVTHERSARAAQARRNRRGTRVCPGTQGERGGQCQRAVDRHSFAAPCRCAGTGRNDQTDRGQSSAGNHHHQHQRYRQDRRTGERKMSLDRLSCLYCCLGCAALAAYVGCTPATPAPVVPAAVAPVRKAPVRRESLPTVKFVDITKESGIAFVHYNGALGEKLLPETMGAGVAFLDYDGDGDQDLFFVNSSYWPGHVTNPAPTQALYRNDGKGHFTDVTKEAGLDKTFYGQGVAVGDYDNDNDPDLYVTAIGRGYLFRNDGKGHFEDVTEQAGAKGPHGWLTGAAFVDIENDGDLDLFICNYINWSPEIDKVQGFQLTGLGRAYGPPTSFSGSFCACCAMTAAGSPISARRRASR